MGMTTANDIITKALSNIGVENATTAQVSDALDALNMMLDSWSARELLQSSTTLENFPLIAGQAAYTIGVGSNFNTSVPFAITDAFIRDSSGIDWPQEIITLNAYMELSRKTTTGIVARPYFVAFDPRNTQQATQTGIIYFYPTPDAGTGYNVYLRTEKPMVEFATTANSIPFPPAYEEALVYNLAIRLAVPFGMTVSGELAIIAKESMRIIENLNSRNKRVVANVEFPVKSGSASDIRTNQGG